MKKFLKILGVVVLLFILAAVGGLFYLNRGLEDIADLSISRIDLTSVADGIYNGEYKAGRFSNKIKVEVRNHQIVNLSMIDDLTFSREEVTEELFDNIVRAQSINVDTVAGATVTSKAYLKAIENALQNQ